MCWSALLVLAATRHSAWAISAFAVAVPPVLGPPVLGPPVLGPVAVAAERSEPWSLSDSAWGFVRVAVPAGDLPEGATTVMLSDQHAQKYLAQIGGAWLSDSPPDDPRVWLTFLAPLEDAAPGQEPRRLVLEKAAAAAEGPSLTWLAEESGEPKPDPDRWEEGGVFGQELQWQGQPLLRLMAPVYDNSTPEHREETYKVFHHLWMPNLAQPITKGSGGEFSHHRGLFMGWNRIRLTQAGQAAEVDTWHAKLAYQELHREVSREAGPVYARQVLEILWVNEAIQPPQPFIRETRELIVFPVGGQRLIQFNSRLESLAGDIELAGDPQHAGFQFRAAQQVAEVTKEQTYYVRPDGVDRPGNYRNWPDQSQQVDLPFHAMSFVIDEQRLTCVRLEHPNNPGPARFSERDYGRFGSYFEHLLTPAQPLQVSYQLRVVPGEIDVATAEQWQRHFVKTPPAQWIGRRQSAGPGLTGGAGEPPLLAELQSWLGNLQPLNDQPLFTGAAGQWDAAIRERGWILYDEGQYKLWYTGYDGQRTSTKSLGLATSPDGLRWTRSAANPLIKDQWVEDVMVVKHDQTYWLFAEGPNDIAHGFRSADGETWERIGELDIRQTDGQPISAGPRGTPTVWRAGDQWYLFYERRDAGIWLASSPDLQVWTNIQDEPVMGLADRDYDQSMIAVNQVVATGNGYVCLFHSSSDSVAPRRWVCSAAVSTDLRNWTKLPEPLTALARNQSSGILVATPAGWRFYTMHDRVDAYSLK